MCIEDNGLLFPIYEPEELPNIIVPYRPGYVPEDEWKNLKPFDLSKIETLPFPDDQFLHDEFDKKQIVLHHTVSGNGVEGDVATWEATPERVATCIIIDRDGIPWQLFSSKYWAYHLGAGNSNLDKHSLGIELDNWGWLIAGDGTPKQFGKNADGTPKFIRTVSGKYYTFYGNSVTVPMQYYANGFRGYNYYEKYTYKQLKTLGELLLYWKMRYNIPLTYNSDMWDVTPRALNGIPGIWTHVSYRPMPEKTDCHPQPELITLLRSLDGIT